MPEWVQPALASLAERAFSDPAWLFEVKWDGVRALACVRAGKTRFWSRSHREITNEYPEFSGFANNVNAREACLDGEIVALDRHGRSDFQRLQERFSVSKPSAQLLHDVPVVYYVFDLLYLDGYDLRGAPLLERKKLLKQVLGEDSRVRYSDHVMEKGRELFEVATRQRLEGIVAKKSSSPYPAGRTSAWLKIKLDRDADAVIGGWTSPRKSRQYFGAILLGLYEGGQLKFIGGAGSGFKASEQKRLWDRLQELKATECPFETEPSTREKTYWVRPALVARIKFGAWTDERHLRQPRFLGLQDDRAPKDCTFEEQMEKNSEDPATVEEGGAARRSRVGPKRDYSLDGKALRALGLRRPEKKIKGPTLAKGAGMGHPAVSGGTVRRASGVNSEPELTTEEQIAREFTQGSADSVFIEMDGSRVHLTHLNKVYFPRDRYTKRDLLAYYFWAAPFILPHLKDRPLVLRRYPDGIGGTVFFQKHATPDIPEWVKTVPMKSEGKRETVRYIVANNLATLLYLTNLGCIDHNPWSSTYEAPDHPSYIFFDLDPTAGTPFGTVVKLAKILMSALEKYDFTVFAKTSGATGFHIFLPIEPQYTYEQARMFVQALASLVSAKYSGLITTERSVGKRPRGSIYVDAHQNSRGQSLACAYSVRAFAHAPVSAPVRLKELTAGLRPEKWNMKSMRKRIEDVGDSWADFWKCRQRLDSLLGHAAVKL